MSWTARPRHTRIVRRLPPPELQRVALILAGAVMVGSLLGVPWLVARLPRDYFVHPVAPPRRWSSAHPAWRWTWAILRNFLGVALVLAGIALLVLPGQGLLTMLAGLVLLDFPGKRRAERSLVRRPRLRGAMNWLRARAGAPPLEPPRD